MRMLELPDVEAYRAYVSKKALHKTISECRFAPGYHRLYQKGAKYRLREFLHGTQFSHAGRRGKYLILSNKKKSFLLVLHFGMTDSVVYAPASAPREYPPHTALCIVFQNGYELRVCSKRKLGKIYFVDNLSTIDRLNKLGREPFEITEKQFLDLLKTYRKKRIKALLMDQRILAGIGNIYADEILFAAGIDPKTPVRDIRTYTRKTLYSTMHDILRAATRKLIHGNTFSDPWLIARRRDTHCPKNQRHILEKRRVAGRMTVYCPEHQKI